MYLKNNFFFKKQQNNYYSVIKTNFGTLEISMEYKKINKIAIENLSLPSKIIS